MGLITTIIVFGYLIIGMLIYSSQEKFAREKDIEFFENLTSLGYFKYMCFTIFLWLPMIITYFVIIIKKNSHK
jgi:uncharacterized BrkB/YihY/UPF0761 family membrane protein